MADVRATTSRRHVELDDAEEEGVEIIVNHAPKRFVIEEGKLVGMEFDVLEWDTERNSSKYSTP